MTLLAVEGIGKRYRLPRHRLLAAAPEVLALDGVSFTLQAGRSLGIVGESGSGKSTLARLVMALEAPTSGRVLLDGVDLHALDAAALRRARARLQMVFQDPYGSLDPRRTVQQTVAEPLAVLHGAGKAEQRERAAEMLDAVGLRTSDLGKYPHEFSGGQRQRIAIARAFVTRPELIVADEPVSALDVSIQAQIVNLLRDVQEKKGLTYLFISHDLKVVQHLCDQVAVMYLGRIVEQASTKALFDRPLHPYTQALIAAIPRPPDAPSIPDVSLGGPLPQYRPRTLLLGGDPPSLLSPPSGCAFHPRCRRYEEAGRPAICRSERPPLVQISVAPSEHSPSHVACHLQTHGPNHGQPG